MDRETMNLKNIIPMADLSKRFHQIAEKLVALLPDWITGDAGTMKKKYSHLYGSHNHSRLILENKILTMKRYLCVLFSFLILLTAAAAGLSAERKEITSIERPEYGEGQQSIPVSARIKYKDYEYSKDMVLKVPGRKPSREEKLELLSRYQEQLKNIILGENTDSDHISRPLNLIERDQGSRITIEWTSSRPDLINEKGEVDLVGAQKGQIVDLRANITLEEVTVTEVYPMRIDGDSDGDGLEKSINSRLKDQIDQAAGLNQASEMILPDNLGDGIEVRWFQEKESGAAILTILLLISLLTVYFKRYDRIDAELGKMEEALIRDLPELINKLVLLLNAGLVINTAFARIVENYQFFNGGDRQQRLNSAGNRRRYLYEELTEIEKRITQSNSSLIHELRDFSQRSGVREMIRLTAILSDNWDKGSTLAEKLEGEGELLWISRKRRAEEKGKLAETKLTFPLMVLLIVLIMVTIAPAMLEM